MNQLIIIGAGGHSKSVIDSLDFNKFKIVGFIDDNKSGKHFGYKILGNRIEDIDEPNNYSYFIAIGDNTIRELWFNKLKELQLKIINIVDKTAIISKSAKVGRGCFIGKMAIINADSTIGDNCIINTKALIEHECSIGNSNHISTNSVVNGNVVIGNRVFIGSSAVIRGQLKINDNIIVGAGAVVINSIKSNTTVVGVPAKEIKRG